ncbi:hypothetical protein J3459_016258 [Metarhizium acridum]|uniref:Uncharacterized protein n=1 Tax=Metarhizium acridum (strain CQMa 102) TaxID=655827 RepID=E9DRH7_METAQ|nr:uncharacterized protein MAC_00346 [Metarhizium acridum CQMa 102]EFY93855.1 hypothetical protein MAC_00346 [Metarhizium acridum CQMa 102]KAG8411835.1 hypothetical protein J3459_016258 [Metarhizium acridum]KAG8421953.1 hypothetical protein J3458_003783 [Metarhizium acridum]
MSEKDPEPSPPVPEAAASPSAGLPDPETRSIRHSAEPVPPPVPPPAFEPLFTLVTNASTGATVHPRVQYLFSDDDASILSHPNDDPNHRAMLVDIAPTEASTWSVQWASSLSPDFAITASQLSVQRSDDASEGDASMMLRIEGVEREPLDAGGSSRPNSLPSSGSGAIGRENVDALADEFKRRMGVLKNVVAEGGKRRDILEKQAGSLPGPKTRDEYGPPRGRESAVQGAPFEDEFPG